MCSAILLTASTCRALYCVEYVEESLLQTTQAALVWYRNFSNEPRTEIKFGNTTSKEEQQCVTYVVIVHSEEDLRQWPWLPAERTHSKIAGDLPIERWESFA